MVQQAEKLSQEVFDAVYGPASILFFILRRGGTATELQKRALEKSLTELEEMKQTDRVPGLYGKVYEHLLQEVAILVDLGVAPSLIHQVFGPVIIDLRTRLQSSHTVMPLGDFENFLRTKYDWQPSAIYTTTS